MQVLKFLNSTRIICKFGKKIDVNILNFMRKRDYSFYHSNADEHKQGFSSNENLM